jgi:hypothetical protein
VNTQSKKMLGAVEDLISYYRRKNSGGRMDCPLCNATLHSGPKWGCDACPWVVLQQKKTDCMMSGIDIVGKRMRPSPQWRTASIRRLTKWVAQIKRGTYERRLKKARP